MKIACTPTKYVSETHFQTATTLTHVCQLALYTKVVWCCFHGVTGVDVTRFPEQQRQSLKYSKHCCLQCIYHVGDKSILLLIMRGCQSLHQLVCNVTWIRVATRPCGFQVACHTMVNISNNYACKVVVSCFCQVWLPRLTPMWLGACMYCCHHRIWVYSNCSTMKTTSVHCTIDY